MRKVLATLAMCLSSGLAVAAAPNVPDVLLSGGDIEPNGQLEISLKGLIKDASYVIRCHGINKSLQKDQMIISMNYSGIGKISVNGREVTGHQFKLPLVDNQIIANVIHFAAISDDNLVLTNFDQNDPVTIERCFATPTAG